MNFSNIDGIQTANPSGTSANSKRVLSEITRLIEFQSEKLFRLDYCSVYDKNKEFPYVIGGRIFPKSYPYCLASFRIEIKLRRGFPFESPEGYILDPIYHVLVDRRGTHCCCWLTESDSWDTRNSLVDYIILIINSIDNRDRWSAHYESDRYYEYTRNYDVFYEKALRSVLTYGQPRFLFLHTKSKINLLL